MNFTRLGILLAAFAIGCMAFQGCSGGETDDTAPKGTAKATADKSKPASKDNAGTNAPASAQ